MRPPFLGRSWWGFGAQLTVAQSLLGGDRGDDGQRSTGYTVTGFGLRAHLPALNAAIGLVQLARFDTVAARVRLWRAYRDRLHALGVHDRLRLVDLDLDLDLDHTVPYRPLADAADH